MNEQTYKMYKDKIREAEDEITHILLDQNLVTPNVLQKVEENIQRIKAFSMNIGGYFLEAGLEEENKRKYGKVLEAQEIAIKQNVENDNRRTEIAEKSLELNKKSIENQIDLKKKQEEECKDVTRHRETLEKQYQRLIAACESIAYSLAKLTVNPPKPNEQFTAVGVVSEFIK